MATRRLRAFKRWMAQQSIELSSSLSLIDSDHQGIAVVALRNVYTDDVVATIPKSACLTIKTSSAREIIESEGLDGHLGLAVALMCEMSLGEASPWAGYLQMLPEMEEGVPLVWTLDEVDELLSGTELHKTVREDKALIYEDWKECIWPLVTSGVLNFDQEFFGAENYFAAKSLISSRSFEVDDFHGPGMVPLADLFNHKTGAEDVHITSSSSDYESEKQVGVSTEEQSKSDVTDLHGQTSAAPVEENSNIDDDLDSSSSVSLDDPTVLEMILIKDVCSGSEVFNTYGALSNAALLHSYGFTEPNNPFDIVNLDFELVVQSVSSFYTERYIRSRVALWRKLDTDNIRQDTDYFEISSEGEPEVELLILLYIISLPEEAYYQLDLTSSTRHAIDKATIKSLPKECHLLFSTTPETRKEFLIKCVCIPLLSLADQRESLYNSNSLQDDIEALKTYSTITDRKRYHSLMLRISERNILQKLRLYASTGKRSSHPAKAARRSSRKKCQRS